MSRKGSQPPFYIFLLVIGMFAAVTYACFVAIYTVQPLSFIDEIFHIPQAQKYCKGNFNEWNPKITTFPGLYLFSIGLNGPVSWIIGRPLCDVFCLRLTNFIGSIFILSTVHKITTYLHESSVDGWKLILSALNISFFPVLYWFTFLYYTDVLSTLLVLVMMLLHLNKAPNGAALIGVVSVLMRQTNIVWVCFLFILLLIDSIGFHLYKKPIHTLQDLKKILRLFWKMRTKPIMLSNVIANVIVDCLSYLAVLSSFAIFVVMNGGNLVVGDQKAHVPTIHVTQFCYFCLFFLVFSLPYAVQLLIPFVKSSLKNKSLMCAALLFGLVVVHNNTLVHPFLLADNRHYTFYLWNRFFGRYFYAKYLPVPVYIFGAYVLHKFIVNRSLAFKIAYYVCVCATIIPQRLVEPRYFILPFLLARLQMASPSWKVLVVEFFYFIFINAATIYLFMNKTIYWDDLEEPQRLMW